MDTKTLFNQHERWQRRQDQKAARLAQQEAKRQAKADRKVARDAALQQRREARERLSIAKREWNAMLRQIGRERKEAASEQMRQRRAAAAALDQQRREALRAAKYTRWLEQKELWRKQREAKEMAADRRLQEQLTNRDYALLRKGIV